MTMAAKQPRNDRGQFKEKSEPAEPPPDEPEGHTSEEGNAIRAMAEALGVTWTAQLAGAMASAELSAAQTAGTDEARQVKSLSGPALNRYGKLVDSALREKNNERALRLLLTVAQQVAGLHSCCDAALKSKEELILFIINETVCALRTDLVALMEKQKKEPKEDRRPALKSLMLRINELSDAVSVDTIPSTIAEVPQFVKVVAMAAYLERVTFQNVLEACGTKLGNGSFATSQLHQALVLFTSEGGVDMKALQEMDSRSFNLISFVANRAVPGGISDMKQRVRDYEKDTHEEYLLFNAGTFEQAVDLFYDWHLDMKTVAGRFALTVDKFHTLLIAAVKQLCRDPPRKPKSARDGCLDLSKTEIKMEMRNAYEQLEGTEELDDMTEAQAVSYIKNLLSEADHKLGLVALEEPAPSPKPAKANNALAAEETGERGRTRDRSNRTSSPPDRRSTSRQRYSPKCAGCFSGDHLLRDCDAKDSVLLKNGFARGTDGMMFMAKGGALVTCGICALHGHDADKCPSVKAQKPKKTSPKPTSEQAKARKALAKKIAKAEGKKKKAKAKKAKGKEAAEETSSSEEDSDEDSDEEYESGVSGESTDESSGDESR